jgi:hypothetical protein
MKNYFPRSLEKDIVMQELLDEVLIYNLKTDKAYCLNKTSALIWRECDGTKSSAKIAQAVSQKLHISIREDFVRLALDNFAKENLLDNSKEKLPVLKPIERRALLRSVGLASFVALPVVFSLVAPQAAAAQSITNCAQVGEICSLEVETAFPCCDQSNRCLETSSIGEFRCFLGTPPDSA